MIDGATVFLGIVIVAVTAMVIYMFVDMTKFKDTTTAELKQNDADLAKAKAEADAKLAAEEKERQSNVNYIVDKTNEANQNLYTRFNSDVSRINTNLASVNNATRNLNSVMRVGSTTSTGAAVAGRPITELPGSGTPNLHLISSVMATNGMTVKGTTKTDKLQLGDKFLLSGVGDAHGNDNWLRVFGKDGKGYNGGIAMHKLWTGGEAHLGGNTNVRGNLNIRGGTSEHNPNKWGTHFPWHGDNKNYIRGDTEIRGNTNNIGDLNVGRNISFSGKMTVGKGKNDNDPYTIEKVTPAPDKSSLRISVNDNNDEAVEIWGGACAAGNCAGPGSMKHKFDAMGNATHTGSVKAQSVKVNRPDSEKWPTGWGAGVHTWDLYSNATIGLGTNGAIKSYMNSAGDMKVGRNATVDGHLRANGDISMPNGKTIRSDGRMHIHGNELLYVLNKNGMIVGKEWGGNGNLSVQGALNIGGNARVGRHIDANNDWGGKGKTLFAGWGSDKTVIGNNANGAHNFALNQPANTIVATNPVHVHGDLNAARVCTGNVCLRGSGDDMLIESRDKTKTIGRLSPGWDKIQLYTNSDGKAPYFYTNAGRGFGVWPPQ